MARTALVIVAVLILLLGLLWIFQRRLIYLPDGTRVPSAGQVIPGARDVSFTTRDGLRLGAWYVPGDHDVTVLVAGGNAGNRLHRAPLARSLAAYGLPVLLVDYRGYGGNPGTPTEEGLHLDLLAARAFLGETRVVYFGESLGAAVASRLAGERPPAGLVLRSPFTDLAAAGQVAYPFLPVRALLRDRFPVTEHVAHVRVPTVVVWGTADTIVPPRLSRAVAKAAAGPVTTVEVPGAGHNDLALLAGQDLIDAVVELAGQVRRR
ncbi:alpha/beta hydrolase [Nonomuraea sp. KC401]|uniref:alpha/beta hydrolase n=1 Tax=unclassified Nonomuraea TaxID=2593643 RepID=UPI0010FF0F64|nr:MULTISPECIES: alpha/beta hydrolase [unclassified Nonomuraea]NBE97294.1 alpha/beta hydrolase [Nonomuraea sp. K271]TLF56029.1 alpha/beta hydrolase [Nonomuraea sp. KC401]